MTVGGEWGQQVLQAIQGLGNRMDRLETWMERLGAEFVRSRAELSGEIQQVRTELKTEIQQVRTELKTEMQEGFRQVHGRIDRLNEASVLMSSELRRAAERDEALHQRVLVLETRG